MIGIIPIVLVHGTRTSSAIWESQEEALRSSGHLTTAVDLPGHGTRTDERFTLAGAMETIDRAVMDCARPPLLVGLSLGGYTSLAYAAEEQHKLSGVVLSGCSTEIAGKPLRAYRRVTTVLADTFRPTGTWHVVADMLEAMHGYSCASDLRRLTLPVWLVNGSRDPLGSSSGSSTTPSRVHSCMSCGAPATTSTPTPRRRSTGSCCTSCVSSRTSPRSERPCAGRARRSGLVVVEALASELGACSTAAPIAVIVTIAQPSSRSSEAVSPSRSKARNCRQASPIGARPCSVMWATA